MYEPFIGQLCQFPYNFAPKGWAFCHGQILSISQYPALFSLVGVNFGGDGRSTFALPDLRPKDSQGKPMEIYIGQDSQGKPYMETSIALEGLFPSRD